MGTLWSKEFTLTDVWNLLNHKDTCEYMIYPSNTNRFILDDRNTYFITHDKSKSVLIMVKTFNTFNTYNTCDTGDEYNKYNTYSIYRMVDGYNIEVCNNFSFMDDMIYNVNCNKELFKIQSSNTTLNLDQGVYSVYDLKK